MEAPHDEGVDGKERDRRLLFVTAEVVAVLSDAAIPTGVESNPSFEHGWAAVVRRFHTLLVRQRQVGVCEECDEGKQHDGDRAVDSHRRPRARRRRVRRGGQGQSLVRRGYGGHRSSCLTTLPRALRGSVSTMTTRRATLKRASCSRQNSRTESRSGAGCPERTTTNAVTSSPH